VSALCSICFGYTHTESVVHGFSDTCGQGSTPFCFLWDFFLPTNIHRPFAEWNRSVLGSFSLRRLVRCYWIDIVRPHPPICLLYLFCYFSLMSSSFVTPFFFVLVDFSGFVYCRLFLFLCLCCLFVFRFLATPATPLRCSHTPPPNPTPPPTPPPTLSLSLHGPWG